jgi:multidrug efflux pump subunit AcrA (membrane-fusion protein)
VASLLPLLAGLAGCHAAASSPPVDAAASPAAPVQVEAVAAESRPWPLVVRVQGSLLADEHAAIGTKVAGRVQKVHVDLGSRVAAGDLLIALEPEEFDLQVREAEAQLEQVRVKLGRGVAPPGPGQTAAGPVVGPQQYRHRGGTGPMPGRVGSG